MLLDRLKDGRKTSKATLVGGVLAALLSSLCCLGPLVLVTLGISGAWIANLAALEPYRPLFLGVAVVCMVLAYRYIYGAPAPAECEPGTLCALPHTQRVYKRMFWGVAALVLGALVFPYLMPFFY
jgi:mercuric ion transport protein